MSTTQRQRDLTDEMTASCASLIALEKKYELF